MAQGLAPSGSVDICDSDGEPVGVVEMRVLDFLPSWLTSQMFFKNCCGV